MHQIRLWITADLETPADTNIRITTSQNEVVLSWEPSVDPNISGYHIYYVDKNENPNNTKSPKLIATVAKSESSIRLPRTNYWRLSNELEWAIPNIWYRLTGKFTLDSGKQYQLFILRFNQNNIEGEFRTEVAISPFQEGVGSAY